MEEAWGLDIVQQRVNSFYENEIKKIRGKIFRFLKKHKIELPVQQKRLLNKLWRNVRKEWKKLNKIDDEDYVISQSDFPVVLKPWRDYKNELTKIETEIFSSLNYESNYKK